MAASTTVTSLSVTAAGAPVSSVAPQTPITLTASVTSGGAPVHPGTVVFCDASAANCLNGARFGSAQLTATGTASLTLRLPSGPHSVSAVFTGTTAYAKSTSAAAAVTVTGGAATTNLLSFSGTQGNYTLLSQITSTGSAGKPPTGTVSLQDTSNGNAVLGSASLVAGSSTDSLTLSSGAVLATGSAAQMLAVGDFNNDGLPDVVTAGTQLAVFLNNGGGSFTRTTLLTVGNSTSLYAPVVGDFNGDGKLDIVVQGIVSGQNFPTEVFVLLGNGDGTFTVSAPIVPGGAYSAFFTEVVGDFNGDGHLDVAVLEESSNTGTVGYYLLTGKGDGTFSLGSQLSVPSGFAFGIVAADFNGDGRSDLATTDDYGNSVYVLLSNGDGTFTTKGPYAAGDQPSSIVAGDFNNDGVLDLATIDAASGQAAFLQGVGDGSFVSKVSFVGGASLTGVSSDVLAVGDFNGDGVLDIVSSGETKSSQVQVLRGNGDGTFTAQAPVTGVTGTTGGAYGVAVADFNGDGTADFVGVNPGASNATVLLNTITTTATATATGISVPGGGQHAVDAVYAGDMLYAASTSNTVTLDVPLTATTLTLNAFPSTGPYGRSPTLLATLSPSNNGTATTNGETITFLKDGNAVGTGTLSNGAATFSPGTLPIGTNTFTTVFGGDNTFAASTSAAAAYVVSAPALNTTTTLAVTVGTGYVTSAALGTAATFTATVAAGGTAVHPGLVRFCDARATACTGAGLLGTAALQSNGSASVPLRLGLGSHLVRAVFGGTGAYATSNSSTATITITGLRSTTTTVVSSGSAGNYTLTATVAGTGSATGPSGSVSFQDTSNANAVVGTAALGAATVVRSFAVATSSATGNQPASLVTADFNRDGIPDAAVENASDGTISVLLGGGSGTLTVKTTVAIGGTGPFALTTSDYNGDGIPDLAVIGSGAGAAVTILLGKGDGTFSALTGPAVASATALVSGDFNGDGVVDLAVATASNQVVTLIGAGDGTFTALAKTATTGNLPSALTAGDFNGDGTLDLAVANSADGTVSVLLNDGDGTFQTQAVTVTVGSHPSRLLAADLNGDGAMDLVAVNSGDGTLSILLGSNNGTFALRSTPAVGNSPSGVTAVDFSGDGVPDLVVANNATPGGVTLLMGAGDGTFTVSSIVAPGVGGAPNAIVVADFNGDGLPDFAVVNGGANTVSVALAQIATNETASLSGVAVPGAGIHNVDAVYPGDSTYAASTSATTGVTGSQVATTITLNTSTSYNSFGQPLTLTAKLSPYAVGIGNTNGETVTFYDGANAIGMGTLSNGVATLSISTLAVGRHTLTAQYGGDSNFIASTSSPAVPYRVSQAVAPTTTALSLLVGGKAVTTVTPGTTVTLTASVVGLGQAVTPGTINFCDVTAKLCLGSALFGTAQLNASGVASLQHVFGVGGYQVVARFAGDTNYGISSSPTVALSVPGSSTTTIAVSGTPGSYVFTGTVSTQGSLAAPVGTVSFLDTTNNSSFASVALNAAAVTQSFATPGTVTGLPTPYAFVQSDFNNDGKQDIFYLTNPGYTNQNSVLAVLLGNADGTFKSTAVTNPGGDFDATTMGDFNNDGNLDVVVAGTSSSGATKLLLLAGKGDGTFTATDISSALVSGGVGAFTVLTADFNLDGNLDLLVIDNLAGPSSTSGGARYTVLLGMGNGTFTAAGAPLFVNPSTVSQAFFSSIGDFNRDGIPDVAYVGTNSVTFYAGNGDGTFAAAVTSTVAATNSTLAPAAVADLNGDGILDIVSANYVSGTLSTLLGNGDGTFTSLPTTAATGGEPQHLQTADFNGDGITDVAVTNFQDGTISVLTGKGDGTFNKQVVLASVTKPTALLVGDFNNDGLPDLFAYSTYGAFADVYLNTAAYTASAVTGAVNVPGTGIHYVDASYAGSSAYNASVSGTIPVTATPQVAPAPTITTTVTLSANPTTSASGQSVTIVATLSPASGSVAVTNGESITFLNNNTVLGTGTLANGVASFTTTALPVGKNSLSGAYNGDAAFSAGVSASLSFVVTQAASSVALTLTSNGQTVTTVPLNTSVLLTATVTSGSAAITPGTVLFCDAGYKGCFGQGLLGTAQVNAQGVAKLSFRFGAGNHTVNAVFLPQKNYSGGTSRSVTLNVTGGTSSTTLAAAGTQGSYTLTATVMGTGPETGPTGSVVFNDVTSGTVSLGTAALGAAVQARTYVAGAPITLPTDTPEGILQVDLNGDGIPDLLTVTSVNGGLELQALLGKGSGAYGAAIGTPVTGITYNNGISYAPLAVGDFNGDGIPDVVVTGFLGQTSVMLGNGDGTFRNSASFTLNTFSLSALALVADFNGDGLADMAISNGSAGFGTSISLYFGKGDGTFTAGPMVYSTIIAVAAAAGDFNADGHMDLALVDGNNSLVVLLGVGDGTFKQTTYTLKNNAGNTQGAALSSALAVGDFNGDGVMDLASTAGTGGSIDILLGNGDGTFAEQTATVAAGATGAVIAAGDLNGDGLDDLATLKNGTLSLLYSNGDGTFTAQPTLAVAGYSGLAIGDANGDGQPDILVASSTADSVQVVANNVAETAIAYLPNVNLPGAGVHLVDAVYAGDALFAGSTSPAIRLNGYNATSTSLTLSANTNSSSYGGAVMLTATLAPSASTDGETVTFQSGTTTLGTAHLAGGFAKLTATALPAGMDSVTATYAGDKTYGTSTSNTVVITVSQANSSVSYNPASTQVYGIAAGTAGILNATGTPAGGAVVYTAKSSSGVVTPLLATTVLPVGTYALTTTYTPADATDYAASSKTVSGYTVTQATPVLTWLTPAPLVYGTQLTGTQLNATANINGAFSYSPAMGAILGVGTQKLTVTFTPTDAIDYMTATASVMLTVTQATPAISWLTPASITYPTPLSSTQLDATSPVAGSFSYSPPAGTVLSIGSHQLMATFMPTDTTDYVIATAAVTLQVVNPVAADFTFATSGTASQTVLPGASGAFSFALAPTQTTYPAAVTFAVSGLPTGAMATFSPSSVAAGGGSQTVVMTVITSAHALLRGPGPGPWTPIAFALFGMPLVFCKRRFAGRFRRTLCTTLMLLSAAAGFAALSGCGGTGDGFFNHPQQSYSLTVTATSGATQHSTSVTLIVE